MFSRIIDQDWLEGIRLLAGIELSSSRGFGVGFGVKATIYTFLDTEQEGSKLRN
jgi:hypothetical protein